MIGGMSFPGGSGPWPPHGGGNPPGGQQPHQTRNPSGMEYHGLGVYDQNPPGMVTPRRRWRGPTILSGAALAVVAGVVLTVALNSGNSGRSSSPSPTTTTRSTSSAPSSSPEPTLPPQTPVVAGWKPVPVPKRGAVYDAPKDWTLERPNNIIAFGEPDDAVTLTGVASYLKGFCTGKPTSYRALTGATARKGGSDVEVAQSTARKISQLVYSADGKAPEVNLRPPEDVQLDNGSSTGTLVTAVVRHPAPGPCDAPTSVVHVLARGNDGTASVVHIGMAEQDVPKAFPAESLRTLTLSFRPAAK